MRRMSKLAFWVAGIAGIAVWTAAIMAVTSLPLPVQLALGGMGLVTCIWGHAVLFPHERPVVAPSSPGRVPREDLLHSVAHVQLPTGTARQIVTRRPRDAGPVADLPPLLRHPFEEAARMEARRLGEAITAAGVFGPVTVRIEADGTAIVTPVAEARDGVRVPAATVIRFATYAVQPDGLVAEGEHGGGSWPGNDLKAAMDAHIAASLPIAPASAAAFRAAAPRPAAAPAAGQTPAWAAPANGARPA